MSMSLELELGLASKWMLEYVSHCCFLVLYLVKQIECKKMYTSTWGI